MVVAVAEDDTHHVPQEQRNLPYWADLVLVTHVPQLAEYPCPASLCPQQRHKPHCWGWGHTRAGRSLHVPPPAPKHPPRAQGPWRPLPDPCTHRPVKATAKKCSADKEKYLGLYFFSSDPYFSQDMKLKQLNIWGSSMKAINSCILKNCFNILNPQMSSKITVFSL